MNLLNFLSTHLLPALGRATVQAAMVVVVVLLAQRLFRDKLAPRWRCALWMLLMARLLWPVFPSSPASLFNFAHWSIGAHFGGSSSRASAAPQTIAGENRDNQPLADVASAAKFFPVNMSPAPAAGHSFWNALSWPEWLIGIWLAGAVVLLSRLVISTIALALRFSRQAEQRDPALIELLNECCQLLGVPRRPAIVECQGLGGPAMHGLFRPQLLLPQGFAARFSTRELRFVFLHELAHLKRWDLPLHWVAAGLQIIHWFNPLIWLAFARWRADREMACDAAALEALGTGQNHDYGRTVLHLLESLAQNPSLPGVIGILDSRDNLERRIQMIARFRPGPRWPAAALLLLAVMAVACLTDPRGSRPGSAEIVQKLSMGRAKNFEKPMKLDLSRFRDYRLLPGDPYFGALAGDRVYDGVPFQIDGRVSLYGQQEAGFARWRHFHDVTGIPVGRKFDELHLLHETRWADVEGETIARYRLHYADGTAAELPICYGAQVRDASRLPTEEKEAISDPSSKIVWRNIRPGPRPSIRVFKSVLLNPEPEKVVASIDVISARHLASYDLLAATVCQHDPERSLTAAVPWTGAMPALDGELAVRVTDKATGDAVAGVLVNPWMSVDGQGWIAAPFYTASNGEGVLHYSKAHTSWIGMVAEKRGYAQGAKFLRHDGDERIPSQCVVELTPVGQPAGGGMASLR